MGVAVHNPSNIDNAQDRELRCVGDVNRCKIVVAELDSTRRKDLDSVVVIRVVRCRDRDRNTVVLCRQKRQCGCGYQPQGVYDTTLRSRAGGKRFDPRSAALATIVADDDWRLRPLARNTGTESRDIGRTKIGVDSAANSVGAETQRQDQRLVYCGALRAFFKPYFLLSLRRASRASRPARFKAGRCDGSRATSERAIARRIAPD